MANKVTASSAILDMEKISNSYMQAAQKEYKKAFDNISRQLWFDMFDLPQVEIRQWYGSKKVSTVKYKQNHNDDKGTILIFWIN